MKFQLGYKRTDPAGYVNSWLESWGFIGNPFEKWDADREDLLLLSRYYIKPPSYEQWLTENKSSLIYARRGGGKSAARIMIQSECRPMSASSPILAVPFTDFSPFAEDFTGLHMFTLQDYLQVILESCIRQLFISLCTAKAGNLTLSNQQVGDFLYWLNRYSPQWNTPQYFDDLLNRNPSLKYEERILQKPGTEVTGLYNSRIKNTYEDRLVSLQQKLAQGSTAKPSYRSLNSSSQIMAAFVEFGLNLLSSVQANCRAIYILIDGIDEYLLTQNDPLASANLLRPLLGNIHFLETPGLAIKFFLPLEYKSAIELSTRTDRIPSYIISWLDNFGNNTPYTRMRELLRFRLLFYSNGDISSLSEMCTSEMRHVIEDAILEETNGVPRHVLQLGNQVFIEHCRETPEPESEITSRDLERAIGWLRGTATITNPNLSSATSITEQNIVKQHKSSVALRIDLNAGRVYLADKEVPALPDLEYRLLAYLYRRSGEICSRDEIIQVVYQTKTGIADEMLGSLVYRLRKALHRVIPELPKDYFIRTASGRGYLLQNAK